MAKKISKKKALTPLTKKIKPVVLPKVAKPKVGGLVGIGGVISGSGEEVGMIKEVAMPNF